MARDNLPDHVQHAVDQLVKVIDTGLMKGGFVAGLNLAEHKHANVAIADVSNDQQGHLKANISHNDKTVENAKNTGPGIN